MKKTFDLWVYSCPILKKLFLELKIAIFVGLVCVSSVFATETEFQQQAVTGKVTDSQTGEAMPGVNIQVKGITIGAITDNGGKYSLSVTDRNATLIFSFIGYVAQEIPLNGRTTVNVALVSEVTGLDEVVVVGYGTQKKVNLTGAVGMATSERLENRPIASVAEGLQGVIPNLNITKPDR